MRFAIIDLGSNSVRMNIVEFTDSHINVLCNIRKVVRLSEGMGDERLLKPNAVKRTLDELRQFKAVIDENNVDVVKAVATAALRSASNRELFLEPVKEIGIDFEIISGEEEAYYDYVSVINTLDVENCMIVDIGGASTELIYVRDRKNVNMVSIPMAAVNMTEKYFAGSVASDEEISNAVTDFKKELDRIDWLKDAKNTDVVGLGGTIRAIAMIYCEDKEKMHGFKISKENVFDMCRRIVKMPIEERILLDGVGKGRADIILGGVIPLIAIMEYIASPNLIACVSGLREGIMYDIIAK